MGTSITVYVTSYSVYKCFVTAFMDRVDSHTPISVITGTYPNFYKHCSFKRDTSRVNNHETKYIRFPELS